MKRAVPNSPTQNPKPAKTNVARVTKTHEKPIPSTSKDCQVPTPDTTVGDIEDTVGSDEEAPSGTVTSGADLTDVLLNKIAMVLKLWIVNNRTKEAARLAGHQCNESHINYLAEKKEYEAGLTPLGLAAYQKTQLEDAMTRRIEAENRASQLNKENLELRYKLMQLDKASDKLSDDLAKAQKSAEDAETERMLRDTARLLAVNPI
ncbi:hypothetical protein FRC11_008648 [Ceratobasidium sp. 423]|nr:hypothetical protein FRC11_008648 [Ceratobasidium sp. 423]